jgi:hypothetical protein
LICADADTAAHYQWGFIDLQTEKESLMQDKYADYPFR